MEMEPSLVLNHTNLKLFVEMIRTKKNLEIQRTSLKSRSKVPSKKEKGKKS
jgi:hypothetical protein